jgi:hypothetical protein
LLSLGVVLRPEIKIEIEPLEAERDGANVTPAMDPGVSESQWQSEATMYVSLPQGNDANSLRNLRPAEVEIKEISNRVDALKAIREGNLVRLVRATVAGKTTEKYVQLVSNRSLNAPPDIELRIDRQPVELGPERNPSEVTVSKDSVLVAVRLKNRRQPWRYARLQRSTTDFAETAPKPGRVNLRVFKQQNGTERQQISDAEVELTNLVRFETVQFRYVEREDDEYDPNGNDYGKGDDYGGGGGGGGGGFGGGFF